MPLSILPTGTAKAEACQIILTVWVFPKGGSQRTSRAGLSPNPGKQSKPRQAQSVSAIGSCASSSETVSLSVLPSTQFIAGNIANCLRAWKKLTTDEVLLKIVTGYELEFTQTPFQSKIPHKTHLGEEEFQIINTEIKKRLHKGVIVKTNHSEGEFISDIFCRPKKDGSHRLILISKI